MKRGIISTDEKVCDIIRPHVNHTVYLEDSYEKIQENINKMENEGVDIILLYVPTLECILFLLLKRWQTKRPFMLIGMHVNNNSPEQTLKDFMPRPLQSWKILNQKPIEIKKR